MDIYDGQLGDPRRVTAFGKYSLVGLASCVQRKRQEALLNSVSLWLSKLFGDLDILV